MCEWCLRGGPWSALLQVSWGGSVRIGLDWSIFIQLGLVYIRQWIGEGGVGEYWAQGVVVWGSG